MAGDDLVAEDGGVHGHAQEQEAQHDGVELDLGQTGGRPMVFG